MSLVWERGGEPLRGGVKRSSGTMKAPATLILRVLASAEVGEGRTYSDGAGAVQLLEGGVFAGTVGTGGRWRDGGSSRGHSG